MLVRCRHGQRGTVSGLVEELRIVGKLCVRSCLKSRAEKRHELSSPW